MKVIDVSKDIDEETGKARHRVSLSMKYVRQEDGTDLDPDGEQAAEELANRRSGGNSGDGGGGRGGRGGGYGGGEAAGVANAIERSSSSNIGMASAIDPMAQRGSRVVLRGGSGPSGAIGGNLTFNGYALVGDDEGEVDVNDVGQLSGNSVQVQPPAKPMGRGRGTTLPAWMTARDQDDNIGGVKRDPRDNGAYNSCNESSSSDNSRSRSRRKKRKKRESSKRKRKSRRDRHKERGGRGDRRRRHSRSRSRSRNRSRSRSRERDGGSDRHRRREKHHKERRREGIKQKRQDRRRTTRSTRSLDRRSPSRSISSRSGSKSRSDNHQRAPSPREFESIEEARALIARLEKKD